MKKNIIIIGALFLSYSGLGQQLGQYSQYLNNAFIINPAAAGEHDYFDIDLSYRQQWAGIDDAPQNYYLSGHTTLKREKTPYFNPSLRTSHVEETVTSKVAPTKFTQIKHGIGGIIAADNYGPFKRLNVNAAYALHIPIAAKFYWSFGANIGWAGMNFDPNFIQLANSSDGIYDQFSANAQRLNLFDLNLGTYAYNDKFFVGYSSNQLLQNKIYFGGTPVEGRQHVHHFIQGGYKFELNDKLDLTPGAMIKYMAPAPISYDINVRIIYDDSYFAGLSYRNQDAVVVMVGAHFKEMFKFAYSYDYVTSNLGNYTSGGHEIIFGLMLNRK